MNAMTMDTTSLSMWKLSATRAIELVAYPTDNSTIKKLVVNPIIVKRRHFLPEYRPILFYKCTEDQQ